MSGIPVVIAENGRGVPVVEVEDANAPLLTVAENGLGMPIVLSTNGIGVPARVEGGNPLRALFGASDTGFLFDNFALRSDYLFQDSAGTVPVAADNDPVARAVDRSGKGNAAVQSVNTGYRPIWKTNAGKPYIQGDAVDDRLRTPWVPTTAGSLFIAMRLPIGATTDIPLGSKGVNERAFFGVGNAGALGAGLGAQGSSIIYGGTDARGIDVVGVLTWNGTTVRLWRDGAVVYQGAQSGAVSSGQGVSICALNNAGNIGSFSAARIYAAGGISRVLTDAEITNIVTPRFRSTYQ